MKTTSTTKESTPIDSNLMQESKCKLSQKIQQLKVKYFDFQEKMEQMVKEYATNCDVFISQILDTVSAISLQTNAVAVQTFVEALIQIIEHNVPVSHVLFVERIFSHSLISVESQKSFTDALRDALLTYSEQKEVEFSQGIEKNVDTVGHHLIKAERAYFILSDEQIFTYSEDESRKFYRDKIDELENTDFFHCMQHTLRQMNNATSVPTSNDPPSIWKFNLNEVLFASCPMKLALSSANNSDRHGAAKMEGSRVLNMAVNLIPCDVLSDEKSEPKPPIEAYIKLINHLNEEPKVIFKSFNDISGEHKWHTLEITKTNLRQSFTSTSDLNTNQSLPVSSACHYEMFFMSHHDDIFRFFKYALYFCGIIQIKEEEVATKASQDRVTVICDKIWSDLMKFSHGYGFELALCNKGPSKSGFSSSSAVMCTILSLLYKATHQLSKLDRVYDLALLAENKLGLRSGWNDTYALIKGIHDWYTKETKSLPSPMMNNILPKLDVQYTKNLERHLVLINTGLQRKATGRMNRRHEVYLSKHHKLYIHLLRSFTIHNEMVLALKDQNFESLGHLMTQYMKERVAFDPDATNPYLQFLFSFLIQKGLIYGGFLAGAMGGGIAQVLVNPNKAYEKTGNRTRIDAALDELRNYKFQNDESPFANGLFGKIEFGINMDGIKIWSSINK